jgi:hypothetical protein
MKAWQFKLKKSPLEISEKIETKLKNIGRFVFNINNENNKSVTFKIRKRALYGWYMAFQNWTVVKGELLNDDAENVTRVKITFNQHFFIRLILATHIILAFGFLIALSPEIGNNTPLLILLGTLLILGIVLGFAIQQKFKRDTQKYKSLLTELFEIQ